MTNVFLEIGLVLVLATIGGFIANLFRQPLLLAYILVGILIGPIGFGLVTDESTIKGLAELGIAFLLFLVGIELNLSKLKEVSKSVIIVAIIQMAASIGAGYLIERLLGFSHITSFYIGLALAFSSTAIVVKLMSDKKELDTLHGRLLIGILLMQDLAAIIALTALTALGAFNTQFLFTTFAKGLLLFMIAMLGTFSLPSLFKFAAKVPELLFLSAVSWCLGMVWLADYFGFSIAIGAFLAGVSLATSTYSYEIIGRIRPLRDFFATLFFVALGMQIVIGTGEVLVPALLLIGYVLLINPIILMTTLMALGYRKKTAFLTGTSLAETGEFSLILAVQGLALGQIGQDVVSLVAIVTAVTVTVATYYIKYSNAIYHKISPALDPLEIQGEIPLHGMSYETILVGSDRIGYSIRNDLRKHGSSFIIIDMNPEVVQQLSKEGIPCIYGDISDPDILERFDLEKCKRMISTVPDKQSNIFLINKVREINKHIPIVVTAYTIDDALELYDHGADYVIMPHFLGGEKVTSLLDEVKDYHDLSKLKYKHMHELKSRLSMGQDHPNWWSFKR